jgi:hypothetical protein
MRLFFSIAKDVYCNRLQKAIYKGRHPANLSFVIATREMISALPPVVDFIHASATVVWPLPAPAARRRGPTGQSFTVLIPKIDGDHPPKNNKTGVTGLSRGYNGWRVKWMVKKEETSAFFSDNKRGGEERSLKLALAFLATRPPKEPRKRYQRTRPLPEEYLPSTPDSHETAYRNSETGVRCLIRTLTAWLVAFKDDDEREHHATFPDHKSKGDAIAALDDALHFYSLAYHVEDVQSLKEIARAKFLGDGCDAVRKSIDIPVSAVSVTGLPNECWLLDGVLYVKLGCRAADRSIVTKLNDDDRARQLLQSRLFLQGNYAVSKVEGRYVRLHRALMGYPETDVDGERVEVDHINRNPLDNTRENLRVVSHRVNSTNRAQKRYSDGSITGVYPDAKKQRCDVTWVDDDGVRQSKGFVGDDAITKANELRKQKMLESSLYSEALMLQSK